MKLDMTIFLFVAIFVCFGYQAQARSLEIYIRSEGCNDPGITGCGRAIIRVNGKDFSKHGRGYNVVVVNGKTGVVESSETFGTHANPKAHNGLIFHLHNIQPRKLVLIAVQDASAGGMTDAAYDALEEFGARNPLKGKLRNSYALLGWSGYGVLDAVTQIQRDRYEGPSIISKVISLPLY